jgi:hypothetical protein
MPFMNNPTKISNVANSVITTGNVTGNITNTTTSPALSPEDSRKLIAFIKQLIHEIPNFPEAKRTELKAIQEKLKHDMASPPDHEKWWLREAMSAFRGVLHGMGGNAAWSAMVKVAEDFTKP